MVTHNRGDLGSGQLKTLLIFIFCQRITNGGRWCPQDFGARTRAGCQRADSRRLSPSSGADLTQSAAFRDASPDSVWLNVWFSGRSGTGAEAGLNSAVWETQIDHHVVNAVTTGQGGPYRCLAWETYTAIFKSFTNKARRSTKPPKY